MSREKTPTALFFKYNSQLGPPYQVLVDTNFINFSIKNKVQHFCFCMALACMPCTRAIGSPWTIAQCE